MHSDKQAWANSVDPDKTPRNAASHQGLYCLPFTQQYLDTISVGKLYLFSLDQLLGVNMVRGRAKSKTYFKANKYPRQSRVAQAITDL